MNDEAIEEMIIQAFYHGLCYDKSLTFIDKIEILVKEFNLSEKIKCNLENYNSDL